MRNVVIILALVLSVFHAFAQADNRIIRKGNSLYDDGKFKDAEISYRKALESNPPSIKGSFNLGNSLYKQNNFDEAITNYQSSIAKINNNDKAVQAAAYHNLGIAYLKGEKYHEAIDAYKQSLRLNPTDNDTRYNLSYALNKMKMNQNQSSSGDKNKNDNQDKNKEQQQNSQPNDNPQQSDQQSQQQKPQISKKDAERMLQALNNDEKKTLDKVNKQKVKQVPVQPEKDW